MKLDSEVLVDKDLMAKNYLKTNEARSLLKDLAKQRKLIRDRLTRRIVRPYPLSAKNKNSDAYVQAIKTYGREYRHKKKAKTQAEAQALNNCNTL